MDLVCYAGAAGRSVALLGPGRFWKLVCVVPSGQSAPCGCGSMDFDDLDWLFYALPFLGGKSETEPSFIAGVALRPGFCGAGVSPDFRPASVGACIGCGYDGGRKYYAFGSGLSAVCR